MQICQTKLLNKFNGLTLYFSNKKDGNLAFHVNDEKKAVIKRHIKLTEKLRYDYKKLIHMKQIHSDIVHIVNDNDNFENPTSCDAIITNKLNTPLMVMVADCSPILMFDDKNKIIAAVHAGRAGAFKNIIQKTISSFINDFNSNVKDISVIIGANIKKCCYEVGYEIYKETKELNLEYAINQKDNKYFLDINSILKSQLIKAGIKIENIEISKECTSCLTNKYFSYRAEKTTGRFAGVIFMR